MRGPALCSESCFCDQVGPLRAFMVLLGVFLVTIFVGYWSSFVSYRWLLVAVFVCCFHLVRLYWVPECGWIPAFAGMTSFKLPTRASSFRRRPESISDNCIRFLLMKNKLPALQSRQSPGCVLKPLDPGLRRDDVLRLIALDMSSRRRPGPSVFYSTLSAPLSVAAFPYRVLKQIFFPLPSSPSTPPHHHQSGHPVSAPTACALLPDHAASPPAPQTRNLWPGTSQLSCLHMQQRENRRTSPPVAETLSLSFAVHRWSTRQMLHAAACTQADSHSAPARDRAGWNTAAAAHSVNRH